MKRILIALLAALLGGFSLAQTVTITTAPHYVEACESVASYLRLEYEVAGARNNVDVFVMFAARGEGFIEGTSPVMRQAGALVVTTLAERGVFVRYRWSSPLRLSGGFVDLLGNVNDPRVVYWVFYQRGGTTMCLLERFQRPDHSEIMNWG